MTQSNLIAVDLAKDVFQVAIAGPSGKAFEHLRLSRTRFEQFLAKADGATVLLEACGSAHFWAREAATAGHNPIILPAQFVRKYRLRVVSSELLAEINDLEAKMKLAEQQIAALTREYEDVALVSQVPGVGLLRCRFEQLARGARNS